MLRKVSRVLVLELNAARITGALTAADSTGRWTEFVDRTCQPDYWDTLAEYEAHYACYEPGSFYRRHVDKHGADAEVGASGQRVISTVCYLNEPGWPADAGGELVLYAEGLGPLKVTPEAGTLVVFRSDTLAHEVLPAQRQRLSIAGWMRTRD